MLLNVLRSFNANYPIEIVIVDDGSSKEHRVDDIINDFDFNVTLIKRPESRWKGPTEAYNIGFQNATGDVIMINSSECVHIGDVIGYVFDNFQPDSYIAFSACMATECMQGRIIESVMEAQKLGAWWGVHSTIGNCIPYCAAISKANMDTLGGYDSRFVDGVGYDDYDFTHRVKNLKLKISVVDDPFVYHQWHKPTDYPNTRNLDLLNYLNATEPDRIRAYGV